MALPNAKRVSVRLGGKTQKNVRNGKILFLNIWKRSGIMLENTLS
jgi:hypothetical protein